MSQKICAVGNRAEVTACGRERISHCVAAVGPSAEQPAHHGVSEQSAGKGKHRATLACGYRIE